MVGAWYIATETTSELKKGGYVQGTVILMLRKRPSGDRPGFKQRVLPEVKREVDAQIKQIAPKVILSVGRVSAQTLLNSNLPVGKLIQQMHQLPGTEIPVKVTYHPAYLLRSPAAKAIAWQDLKLLHRMLQ